MFCKEKKVKLTLPNLHICEMKLRLALQVLNKGDCFLHFAKSLFTWRLDSPVSRASPSSREQADLSFVLLIRFAYTRTNTQPD